MQNTSINQIQFNELVKKAKNLHNSGNFNAARAVYKELIHHFPNNGELLFLLGSLYGQMGQFDQCITMLEHSLSIKQDKMETYNNLALAYELSGQLKQAAEIYEKALTIWPDNPLLLSNLGDLYRKLGKYDSGLRHLNNALSLLPGDKIILLNKANLLVEMNDYDGAHKTYTHAIELHPNNVKLLSNFSALLQLEEQFQQAEELARKAVSINPQYPQALSNLGNVLIKLEHFEEAEVHLRNAIGLNPNYTEAHINLGFLYHNMAKFSKALDCFNTAIKINPETSNGHWYRAFTLLITGQLEQAWKDYDYGLINGERMVKQFDYPRYTADKPLANTILVNAEQGIGDQVMFASCLPDLLSKNVSVILECDKRLLPLFARSFPEIKLFYTGQFDNLEVHNTFPGIQQKIAIGSLPGLFRNKLNQFPNTSSYLKPDPRKVEKWKKRLDNISNKAKIGISWQGGIKVDHKKRSIPLEAWNSILTLDCDFINLQYGNHVDEIECIKKNFGVNIHDWEDNDSLKDLDEFSALISSLDLVISVGNTNVHLAGSLNIPTWCLLPHVPSWRWLFNSNQCLWYPSVNIYRQATLHNWDPVLENIRHDLSLFIQQLNTKRERK